MAVNVLIAIDGSRYALAAARFAAQHLVSSARVQLVHALPPAEVLPGRHAPRRTPDVRPVPPDVRKWFEQAEARLAARGLRVEGRVRRGVPTRVVPELASEGRFDLVVIGAKGRSDVPFLPFGSVALAVLEQVPTNVLMVREREPRRRRQPGAGGDRTFPVLFATDGSSYSIAAVRTFFRLFDVPRLAATVAAVADVPEPATLRRMEAAERNAHIRRLEDAARRWLRQTQPELERHGVEPKARAARGRPAKVLTALAERSRAGLVVLGSRGTHGSWGPRLGSVALGVARASPCSVLIARGTAGGRSGERAR